MIETVAVFGLMMAGFEFVLLCMLAPRTRLRLLGNHKSKLICHLGMLFFNIIVHWGTAVGTMSSTAAFIASLGVLEGATRLFGKISEGRYYTIGLIRYSASELK